MMSLSFSAKNVANNNSVLTRINKNKYRIRKTLSNASVIKQRRQYKYKAVSSNWKRLTVSKWMRKIIRHYV